MNKIRIVFTATMSAGKTTCINALLGTELLHSANEATTATITEIQASDVELIRAFDSNKAIVKEVDALTADTLKVLNQSQQVQEILVKGKFNFSENLVLIDTPGPNNSRDESHKNLAYEFIEEENFDYLVYVINATQPFINDDVSFLKFIKRTIDSDKIIFLVNKIDDFDLDKESIESFINNLKNYLNDLGFVKPIIFSISAYRALLINKFIRQEKLSKKEKRELFSFLENEHEIINLAYTPFSPEQIAHIKAQKRFECLGDEFEDYEYLNHIYCNTGFPYFEFSIKNQIFLLNK
ncbi:hypothetical protein F7P75_10055 [Acinetobacter gandensis]|uniref:Dynamin N-terminal domain-containing protein n=1 Tax=Acinetobacter gandensis TaxID=1443941 RepID=A0A1A7R907_9GAMM|nr:dynamin family protein [Acinetobacter gandensis]KAB0625904.1 hypothetical protein F7P75_10055 [Acinetobacter gandensis]OBX27959.1 hypothetical protein A9J31_07480 [Acinetobacter gandensis]